MNTMNLIVDTNIIIAALIKNSASRKLITHSEHNLMTVNFSEKETAKYKQLILRKAKITEQEYDTILENLKSKIVIIDDNLVKTKMNEAKIIMDKIDPGDTPFIAAALATNSAIWSDDKHFVKPSKIKIYTTKYLLENAR